MVLQFLKKGFSFDKCCEHDLRKGIEIVFIFHHSVQHDEAYTLTIEAFTFYDKFIENLTMF